MIPDAVLLRWDEIVARLTDRTETCGQTPPRRHGPHRPSTECARRFGHRGRHVWRRS